MEEKNKVDCEAETQKGHTRHVVAFMLFLGVIINYLIQVMLSVAIVAMVKSSSSSDSNNSTSSSDTCPGTSDNETDTSKDGPFDWTEQEQGVMLSAYYYGYIGTQLLGGLAADRFGGRWVFGTGLFLAGVFSALSPLAANLHQNAFIAIRVLQGLGSGVIIPTCNVLIAMWFTLEERTRAVGFILSANYCGTLISMSLSGLMVDEIGWESVFYIFGAIAIVYTAPLMYFVYDSPEAHPRISDWERKLIINGRQENSSDKQEVKKGEKKEILPIPWFRILTSYQYWAIVWIHAGLNWMKYTLLTQLPNYIANILHFSIKKSGLISALPYLFAWIFASLFGTVSSWVRAKGNVTRMNAYRIFTGIACLGPAVTIALIVALGCDTTAIIVCLVATTMLMSALYGGAITQHLDVAPNFAGATTGILYTTITIMGTISPVIVGAIINGQNTRSSWNIVFYITIAMLIAPYIFYVFFATDKELSWNQPKERVKESDTVTQKV